MKEIGMYIHIPFCAKKCDYCDFLSYANKKNCIESYIKEIIKEIGIKLKEREYNIQTVYIGGGTPSFINSKYIVQVLNSIKENVKQYNPTEVTIEVNPGTVDENKLKEYINIGINRLSVGLQETNNELLKSIGRIHTYEEFLEVYNLARKVGFKNINVDLMIGLPNQNISDIKESLNKIINLNPEHISVYSLILEEGTKLYERYKNNEINLPDEELERNMYWYVKDTLENNGYAHYEVSNFAKKGYESKHNLDCWSQKEYIGIGLSAHSYINGERFSNELDINDENKIKYTKVIHEIQTNEDMQKEYMLLGLRKIEGISIQEFKNRFGSNPIYVFMNELNKLVKEELLIVDGDRIRLTNKGLDLANIVWEEFV